ncbi:hypothetical protein DM01DRAFT_300539 [Hesseltinella vesiculosa]|uniref:DUF2421 domain-containing protein n=1 Tax=Hesseltinella vesiculosa TaxID=101127 RepID=A0A1X2GC66_9FUNG|nr:hypothetical protein DM01DRAFT_300539 [Hesseltinella vesiculosa]
MIGLAAACVLLAIPEPMQGRTELRKRLAVTIQDISRMYSIIYSTSAKRSLTKLKAFKTLALDIRRQIADERNLLAHTKYEPPLRGKFPLRRYTNIVQIVDNLADLVISMGYTLQEMDNQWREKITAAMVNERRDYLVLILTNLKLISSALASKAPLPPYMPTPQAAKQKYAKVLQHRLSLHHGDMDQPSLTPYGSYMMNGSAFIDEVQLLLEEVTELVGTEDPEEWLAMHT